MVRFGQEGFVRGWGGLPKILQKEQNRGEETKTFKKRGGMLDQGMSALKRGGAGTPLQTMNRFFRFLLNFFLIWLISVQQILPTIAENIIFTKNSC